MRRGILRTLLEALAVAAVGLAVGLVANAASKDGIALGKDHLRRAKPAQIEKPPAATNNTGATIGTQQSNNPGGPAPTDPAPVKPSAAHQPDEPFTFINHREAREVYFSDNYAAELAIFIDARNDDHYLDGHVPGAYQLDHYRAERYMTPELLGACQAAIHIVIYCAGGTCEDSRLAAEDLMLAGIDSAKICIDEDGITRWQNENMPIEVGERLSGQIINADTGGEPAGQDGN